MDERDSFSASITIAFNIHEDSHFTSMANVIEGGGHVKPSDIATKHGSDWNNAGGLFVCIAYNANPSRPVCIV